MKSESEDAPYGVCDICGLPIEIPGLEAYLCSSRVCGADIIIKDKKKKKVLSRHPAKGWVRRDEIESIKKKLAKKKARRT